MIIRRLNEHGLSVFEEFVRNIRDGSQENVPTWLLHDALTSEAMDNKIEFEPREYASRYELGQHLVDSMNNVNVQALIGNRGFWSWIALCLFDQLCPDLGGGRRKPQMPYSYVLSNNWKHRPRHAIFTTWQLVDKYGEDSRFLLSKKLPVRGELIEQLMARQYFFGCEGIIRLASQLYYDTTRETFKVGAAGRKSPGCVFRFVNWLQQLEVNYDLYSLNNVDLGKLLPGEFARFSETFAETEKQS